ncbi:MAG: hypothetical protein LV481_05380 [Methylacidiphilales bacterium]|nr:hypothetical protein [Candidatus Methylacidiphilales bacterium]
MPDPVLSLIAFCDLTVVEQGTGKNTLVGLFQSFHSQQFPFKAQRFFVHVSLTNLVMEEKVTLAVNVKQATGAVVGSFGLTANLPKPPPSAIGPIYINFNIPLTNVTFPIPGDYIVEALYNGEPVGQKPLHVHQASLPNPNIPNT